MDRVLASEARGCGFDPRRAHHRINSASSLVASEVPEPPRGAIFDLRLNVYVPSVQRVAFYESTSRFNIVTHQGGKYFVGSNGVFDLNA